MASRGIRAGPDDRRHLTLDAGPIEPARGEHGRSRGVEPGGEEPEQQVLGVDVVVGHRPCGCLRLDDGAPGIGPEPRHRGRAAAPDEWHASHEPAVALLSALTGDAEHGPDLCPGAPVATGGVDEVVDHLVAEHAELRAEVARRGDPGEGVVGQGLSLCLRDQLLQLHASTCS